MESGLSWIPYLLERLDTCHRKGDWRRRGMPIDNLPSDYWYQNMAATFEEDLTSMGMRDKLGVRCIRRQRSIEIRLNAIDGEHRNVLEERRQEKILQRAHVLNCADCACRGGAEQRAAPVASEVDTGALAALVGGHQGEAERERRGGVESEGDQRLTQVLALAAFRIEGRIRDSQYLGGQPRIFADRRRHFRRVLAD